MELSASMIYVCLPISLFISLSLSHHTHVYMTFTGYKLQYKIQFFWICTVIYIRILQPYEKFVITYTNYKTFNESNFSFPVLQGQRRRDSSRSLPRTNFSGGSGGDRVGGGVVWGTTTLQARRRSPKKVDPARARRVPDVGSAAEREAKRGEGRQKQRSREGKPRHRSHTGEPSAALCPGRQAFERAGDTLGGTRRATGGGRRQKAGAVKCETTARITQTTVNISSLSPQSKWATWACKLN